MRTSAIETVGSGSNLELKARIPDLDSAKHSKLQVDDHYRDFIDAIRAGRKPNAEIEIGFHSAAVCNLGNVATRIGRALTLDAEKLECVGDPEATRLLGRRYRTGGHWAIPKLGDPKPSATA